MSTTTDELKDQLLSILVKDFGYASRPPYGGAPLRHQFAWDMATDGTTPELLAGTIAALYREIERETEIRSEHHRERQSLRDELTRAKAYSQQVVVNITEEMNGLNAGNARLLRELEELRKDKARLDFIDAQVGVKLFYASRQAIDLDMEASK